MTYSVLERTPYGWSYCLGNTPATSIYQVYPGWGSCWVTRCLADPEAVGDNIQVQAQHNPNISSHFQTLLDNGKSVSKDSEHTIKDPEPR
jgi:hypothetical protein